MSHDGICVCSLSEREADGVNVIDWYHRQFIEASRERYFRNLNFVAEMHSCLADYFLGLWGGKPKPFEYSDLQRSRFFLEDKTGESDRKVWIEMTRLVIVMLNF